MEPYKSSGKDRISYWADVDYERHIRRIKAEKAENRQINMLETTRSKFLGFSLKF